MRPPSFFSRSFRFVFEPILSCHRQGWPFAPHPVPPPAHLLLEALLNLNNFKQVCVVAASDAHSPLTLLNALQQKAA